MECCHHRHNPDYDSPENHDTFKLKKELETLKSEISLKNILEQNLKVFNNLSESPTYLNDCPLELYARLISTMESKYFLLRLESLNGSNTKIEFPFKKAIGDDKHSAKILINVNQN
ncbi:hypothetical protein CXB51_016960 [Gossypium anomalum]|uniref:Uncharacterized protein n=1 Tax=Gossypium anomalum TaxID=47600 RepID=A0A8J6D2L9_9ROSI|nr:hypothetical protein CXB51_016960 [Gossypium anomalum]